MRPNALIPELAVGSLSESLHFYRDLAGFRVAYQRAEEGFAFLERGQSQVMLDQIGLGRTWQTGTLERPLGRGLNLQIAVDDLDALLATLTTAGVPLFLPLEARSYDIAGMPVVQRQFAVQDPDGYLLRFCEQ